MKNAEQIKYETAKLIEDRAKSTKAGRSVYILGRDMWEIAGGDQPRIDTLLEKLEDEEKIIKVVDRPDDEAQNHYLILPQEGFNSAVEGYRKEMVAATMKVEPMKEEEPRTLSYGIFELDVRTGDAWCGKTKARFAPGTDTYKVFRRLIESKRHNLTPEGVHRVKVPGTSLNKGYRSEAQDTIKNIRRKFKMFGKDKENDNLIPFDKEDKCYRLILLHSEG